MNFNNSESNAVVIPINPQVIIRGYPNMEVTEMEAVEFPNEEGSHSNGALQTPPPPGLTDGNNNKQSHQQHDDQDNNSNGNGNINNHFVDNPSSNNNCFSDYSQSPFNPLAMSINDYDTRHDENNCEELSLASNQFKLFVDETLKRVAEPHSNGLKARLIIPQDNRSARWCLKIFGPRADLVQAAKKEIMRSPSLANQDDEVDLEASLRTSKTIESLLLEDGEIMSTQAQTQEHEQVSSIDFPTLASLSGLLLGPKYHVIKRSLAEYDCTITWEDALAFIPTNSSLNLRVSGKDPKAVSSVIQLLKSRSDRIDEIPLAVTTLVIDSGKLDWIYSSGAIKNVEEALWKCGATLTQLSDSQYQVTCLTGALLSTCLKRLHEILSRHQSAHFTFRFRNDFRDFSTKCAGVFETLAQVTDCAVSQKCGNGSVEVEIGGSARDLARALIRLDTLRSQIFETGSFDLKLVENRLRLHVPAEIREFICGKKDGKLTRIIKETGVNISLNVLGGDSMYVELLADDHMGVNFGSSALLHALRLIEGELPSEMTFHVPEVHHKRMIGHGGKVIQRIMKKWGVYVKFMNSHEAAQSHQLIDPLTSIESPVVVPVDNVVVRTPSKNGAALKSIKDEIFEECSASEVTGQFDYDAFNTLKRIQSSSKSRVTVSLPIQHRPSLSSLLRLIRTNSEIDCALMQKRSEADLIVFEGEKAEIVEMISLMAEELKNELSFEVTVATLNPFDLLNEDVKPTVVKTKVPATTAPVTTTTATKTPSTTAAPAASKPKRTENSKKSPAGELNANVAEKTPLRRGSSINARRTPAAGNERQERRRTDRHSRTGYKQDGEKRMTAGKGSWGKAVEGSEQHVSVDESVAIVEQVESLEIAEESAEPQVVEPVTPHLTLAQYQATLKKPVVSSTSAPRKVTTALPAAQIVKKETEVFVFPEIVKKTAVKKSAAVVVPVKATVDVSKYISVKAVASSEPRAERTDRPERDNRESRNNRDSRNPRDNRDNRDNRESRDRNSSKPATKLNLKDERSFPTLGSK